MQCASPTVPYSVSPFALTASAEKVHSTHAGPLPKKSYNALPFSQLPSNTTVLTAPASLAPTRVTRRIAMHCALWQPSVPCSSTSPTYSQPRAGSTASPAGFEKTAAVPTPSTELAHCAHVAPLGEYGTPGA